jgi:hypothetical protein
MKVLTSRNVMFLCMALTVVGVACVLVAFFQAVGLGVIPFLAALGVYVGSVYARSSR